MGQVVKLAGVIFTLFLATTVSHAMDKPTDDVILSVSGNIELSNGNDGQAQFDSNMLDAFPAHTINTTTPWTDGEVTFEGPLLRDIMKSIGATGKTLKAIAHNDYSVNIPVEDYLRYDVIIATKRDGKEMTLRTKGPLWIIYPWDSHEELKTELYHSRSIWQLKALEIQ